MADRETPQELAAQYERRFAAIQDYRQRVWSVLAPAYFQNIIPRQHTVLDLGCGWGEFINQIQASAKFGMDLNPDSVRKLAPGVVFLHHDCSQPWPVAPDSLDTVFTSNFFEHLPDKTALKATLAHAFRALRAGGQLICMGPNIKAVPGAYWDFADHHVALTELSLRELLELAGFRVTTCRARFLPYTAVGKRQAPLWMIRLYLKLPFIWRWFGGQFLVIASKP